MGCWDGQRRYQSHVTEVHIVIPGKLAIAGATWNPGVSGYRFSRCDRRKLDETTESFSREAEHILWPR